MRTAFQARGVTSAPGRTKVKAMESTMTATP